MTISIWSLVAAPFVMAGFVWLLEIIDRKQQASNRRTDG